MPRWHSLDYVVAGRKLGEIDGSRPAPTAIQTFTFTFGLGSRSLVGPHLT